MNVFCVLSSRDQVLENYKRDKEMAKIFAENHLINCTEQFKQRVITPPSTFVISTKSHLMSEKMKSKVQNSKSYSPRKRDVQSVFKNFVKFYNEENSVKLHFPKKIIIKYNKNDSTENFMLIKQYLASNSKLEDSISSPPGKEKYSLIQKQMSTQLDSYNVNPQLSPTTPKWTQRKTLKKSVLKRYASKIDDIFIEVSEDLVKNGGNIDSENDAHQNKISENLQSKIRKQLIDIQDKSLQFENDENIPHEEENLLTQEDPVSRFKDVFLGRRRSSPCPNSSLWKETLQSRITESFSEDKSIYSIDAYDKNLKKLNGTYKVYYKELYKLYVKAFFQSGSPNRISIAKYLVKFFTAQQLEAIEISAHRKNILNAPLAPSKQVKFYQNQMGNIFYYTKQIQNFISPNLICQLDLYLHIPIVEDEHSFHKVIQKIKIATFIRYFLCQKYHGAKEVFKKIVV